ncbi:hypothetical protein ACP8HI_13165 [Paenibacillus sp. FA6]|uniref:hypothetical protein n=1 Tax=Paenibacillus sp. FA6 TaxID=3413029 RepID=UPI003F6608E3
MTQLIVYNAPKEASERDDFTDSVRTAGEPWEQLFVYEVKVDMHDVRQASMVYFDMEGEVEVRVESREQQIEQAVSRLLSANLSFEHDSQCITITLDRPRKLSIEINGQRFSNLHLFANPLEENAPLPDDANVLLLKPAIHRTEDIYQLVSTPGMPEGKVPDTIYFAPGMHYLEEMVLRIPSGTYVFST